MTMKKAVTFFCALVLVLWCAMPVFAAEGNVTYSGDAGDFLFAPGSEHSPTDLFPNFKEVMPGDSITQPITLRNDASGKVKVKIYLRSLGAQNGSADFLSQLQLRVQTAEENEMAYMFDAAAGETAQLTEWVCLGTLYSGGEVTINVILDVPVELGSEYQQQLGYLDWEFMVEEFPIEPTDPEPPKTGDASNLLLWLGLMLMSLCGLVVLFLIWKRNKKD
jgi:LPXTG-motif cell wall-anchored protein